MCDVYRHESARSVYAQQQQSSECVFSPRAIQIHQHASVCVSSALSSAQVDLNTGVAGVWSGDGYERNHNGPSGFLTSWAQPSGLAVSSDGTRMFVADSESSAV